MALRVFVKRSGRINGGLHLIYSAALLPVSLVVSATLGEAAAFGTFAVGALVGVAAFGISAARRMMALGFAQADLAPAFKAELETTREERAAEHSRGSTLVERCVGWTARALATFSAVAIPITTAAWLSAGPTLMLRAAVPVIEFIAEAAAVLGLSYVALLQLRRDVDTEFWNYIWTGPIGRDFFAIAKRLHRGGPVASAMTHRATELSLGMAAEQLYESLPKETRQALGDLPNLLHRLQRDAQGLRERYDQLQDAIAESGDAAAGSEYESVRATRDLVATKLGDAVGALETIRLNLLRLHAGSATVEGLTTHLGIAADISDEIDRMIAASDDVESQLRFPSEAEPTPV